MAKILVVEDDRATLRLFVDALSAEGYSVLPERDGETALRTFDREAPELIITDVLVPGLNGFQIAERVRITDHGEQTPIIMVSGIYKSAEHRREATVRYRIADYLVKPVRVDALYAAVKSALAQAEAGKRSARAAAPVSAKDFNAEAQSRKDATPEASSLGASAPLRQISASAATAAPFALTGTLEKTPFAELFQPIYRARATGALFVMTAQVKKIVYVSKGYPTIVRSNILGECLGRILVTERFITQPECDKSLDLVRATGRLQGAILLEMGVMSPQNLKWALEKQLEVKLFDIFSWERGQYQYNARSDVPTAGISIDRSPANLIFDGVRRAMSPARIVALLMPRFDLYPVRVAEPLMQFQEVEMSDADRAFLGRLDGRKNVRRLLAEHELGPEQTPIILYSLLASGIIECRDRVSVAAPSATPTSDTATPIELEPVPLEAAPTEPEQPQVANRPSGASAVSSGKSAADSTRAGKTERVALLEFLDAASKKDHFQLFGIPRDFMASDLRRSYLKLARDHHPDRFAGFPDDVRDLAARAFAVISDALATLENPQKRADYIATLTTGKSAAAVEEQVKAVLQAEVEFQRGEALLRSKRFREAIEAFRAAVKLYPDEGEHHAMLGWAIFQANPRDIRAAHEAQGYLKRGLQLNPKIERAYVFLGHIFKAMENRLAAEAMFEKSLTLNPDNIEAQRELRLLTTSRGSAGPLPRRRR
ncbi:MAG: response regulator [Deltaproteobacteria bacterium]|nr:response regulator [Deltaproteobacteria bacterium]